MGTNSEFRRWVRRSTECRKVRPNLCSTLCRATQCSAHLQQRHPQKGTFITLNGRQFLGSRSAFVLVSTKTEWLFLHASHTQPDRTFLCEGVWRDVISAHTTQPATTHQPAPVHPAAGKAKWASTNLRAFSLPTGAERMGHLEMLSASSYRFQKPRIASKALDTSESRSCWSRS
jgi:hypothetical protein